MGFHPGVRNSTASYTVSLLKPQVVRDLQVIERGLRMIERSFSIFSLLPDERAPLVSGDLAPTKTEVARLGVRTAQ